jgi:hypothetical protein
VSNAGNRARGKRTLKRRSGKEPGTNDGGQIPDTGRLFITNRFLDERIGDLASTEEAVLLPRISKSRSGHVASIRRLPN